MREGERGTQPRSPLLSLRRFGPDQLMTRASSRFTASATSVHTAPDNR